MLTVKGALVAAALRSHRAEGGSFGTFRWPHTVTDHTFRSLERAASYDPDAGACLIARTIPRERIALAAALGDSTALQIEAPAAMSRADLWDEWRKILGPPARVVKAGERVAAELAVRKAGEDEAEL